MRFPTRTLLTSDAIESLGSPLVLEETVIEGTGAEINTNLTTPAVIGGGLYLIDGVALVRANMGQSIGSVAVSNMVASFTSVPDWESGHMYGSGMRVNHDGHCWQASTNNPSAEPLVSSHVGWTDLGAESPGDWNFARSGDVSPEVFEGSDAYFTSPENLPGVAFVGAQLAIACNPIDGQTVRVSFNGNIRPFSAGNGSP